MRKYIHHIGFRMLNLSVLTSLVIGILLSTMACDSDPKIVVNQDAQKEISKPSISEWRYELKTSSYSYLTKNLNKSKYQEGEKYFNKYTLNTYWVNDKNNGTEWSFSEDTITLDEKIHGYIQVNKAPDFEIR